jgi:DNA-directed RNA polymerase specialized sigma24 family protein
VDSGLVRQIEATLLTWHSEPHPTLILLARFNARARDAQEIKRWMQDLLNELWVEAHKRVHKFSLADALPPDQSADLGADLGADATTPPRKPPVLWLLTLAADICRNRKRQARRDARKLTRLQDDSFVEEFFMGARAIEHDDPIAEVEVQQAVDWLLGLLHPKHAHVLRLYIEHDRDYTPITDALHLTLGTARVRVFRALRLLKKAVAVWQARHPDQELPWPFQRPPTPPTEEEGR